MREQKPYIQIIRLVVTQSPTLLGFCQEEGLRMFHAPKKENKFANNLIAFLLKLSGLYPLPYIKESLLSNKAPVNKIYLQGLYFYI